MRLKLIKSLRYRRMEIGQAVRLLIESEARGHTHATVSVAQYETVQPKQKAPRINRLASTETPSPGKIRPRGVEGTIRSFPSVRDEQ